MTAERFGLLVYIKTLYNEESPFDSYSWIENY